MCAPNVAHLHRSLVAGERGDFPSTNYLVFLLLVFDGNGNVAPSRMGLPLGGSHPLARSTWRTRGKARLVRRNKSHQAALKTLKSCKARRQP